MNITNKIIEDDLKPVVSSKEQLIEAINSIEENRLEREMLIKDLETINGAPLEGDDLSGLVHPLAFSTDSGDEAIEELNQIANFEIEQDKFKSIINSIQNPEDRKALIVNFYNKIPNKVWNDIMYQVFKTVKTLNFEANQLIKQNLIDYAIREETVNNLNDIRYKTSSCERSKAWQINEDASFGSLKPEVLGIFRDFQYTVKAKVEEETIKIPYQTIIDNIKIIDSKMPGFFEYLFIISDPEGRYNDLRLIKQKGIGAKALENNLFLLFGILRYRNDKDFNDSLVWNSVIRSKISTKDIGYFTVCFQSRYLGNIWVDPEFRGKGIAKAMLKFVTDKLLPKLGYIYVMSKTPAMLKLLDNLEEFDYKMDTYKYQTHKIGKALPYTFPGVTQTGGSRKGLDYHVENLYVIDNGNEEFIHDLKRNNHTERVKTILFDEDFYSTMSLSDRNIQFVDLEIPTMEELFLVTRQWYIGNQNQPETKIKIIGYTNDKNVIPGYYNYYNEQDDYFKHLVYEYDGETYLYPCHDNKLHFGLPMQDIRTVSKKLDFDYEIYYTPTNTLVEIKYPINKVIILGEDFTKDEEKLYTKNFKILQFMRFITDSYLYGIENSFNSILNNERYRTKINDKFKINDLTPIDFDTKTLDVKFESKDKTFTLTKNIKEIINFLL